MCGGSFCFSGLALSVKACRLCQLSQRESPWHNGKVSGTVQRRPLGGAGERSEPEGVASALPKAALQMSSPATTLLVKMGYRNARRRSDIPKFKIILPLNMPKATTTTAASGGNREELLGQRPARRACRPRHDADAGCRNPLAAGILNPSPFHLDFPVRHRYNKGVKG